MLPQLITIAVWVVIAAVFYGPVILIKFLLDYFLSLTLRARLQDGFLFGDLSMQINPQTKITMLPPEFIRVVNNVIQSSPEAANGNGVILNFRDPTYSAENGRYHPVEISIDPEGNLQYITDFSYTSNPPFAELEKELDWDFTCNRFSQFDRDFDIECGRALIGLYTRNFCTYFNSGVNEVTVTPIHTLEAIKQHP